MKNIVILISGRGSNMEAIVRTFNQEKWDARLSAVISNRADAAGLGFAGKAGIPTRVVSHKDYPDRESYDAVLQKTIDEYQPDLLILAGFMRILTTGFVEHYTGRMINIHPSLLPSFRGLHTHQQAIDAGVRVHGATVHFVTPELDGGPIIAQAIVPVFPDDNEDKLADRVLEQEHRIYPRVVRLIVEDRISLNEDGSVNLSPEVVDSLSFIVKGGGL
ncbi:phosphoribosylglycinamide formyltransferase [Oxalobacter formigenes]|uniref:Phosphoribosylglycinamide formyltransferase n=1 Tax=Oxalobacter formigenes OXCC13 TaxID=556269 RepID=C3X9Y9_OXAFO|nr:phosphoribosylglycinamide formyltransferase [Oxalobacter formigenes]ARQ45848.1 Phosphoribosylglycinamide formyltransferase [Oxalobacter formigenes]ARQ78074.1 phosphoribosylglycinamide formyltransferase [Oxalobacter formigenes OXCC13]EEO30015.1 phosphoribosylglycinamide formyltransferase [Oxalobacter formigenes OXCC13]MCZ4062244.1 phosphoribosylglycinamide formyltransferase [Oxalobacter formigenes]QDX33381.1 phosphoribosylglycinamide formyltransferase [Oxalobacter formigenes]